MSSASGREGEPWSSDCIRFTIADTTGSVWWQRRGGPGRLYQPVEPPEDCRGASCWAGTVRYS